MSLVHCLEFQVVSPEVTILNPTVAPTDDSTLSRMTIVTTEQKILLNKLQNNLIN